MRARNSTYRNIIAAAALVALSAGVCGDWSEAGDLPGKGISVQPMMNEEPAAEFQTQLVNFGLKRLGYDVQPIKYVDIPAAYIAVSQGDGDFYTQSWDPLQDAFYERAGGEKKLSRIGVLIDGAAQGYLIDKPTAEKFKITHVEQLKDKKIAELFDSDGDGKADLIGCPPGWGCERVIEYQLDNYGLRDRVTHKQGDFTALHMDAITRAKAGESVLYYSYTPLWLNQLLVPGKDVEWLEVSSTKLPPEQMTDDTKLPDGRNIGWGINQIRIIANNDFLDKNPAARRWFELVQIPLADVNEQSLLIYNGEDSDEDIHRNVEKWVAKNKTQVEGWIAEAIKASE